MRRWLQPLIAIALFVTIALAAFSVRPPVPVYAAPLHASLGEAIAINVCYNNGGWPECHAQYTLAHEVVVWVVQANATTGSSYAGVIGDAINMGCGPDGYACAFHNGSGPSMTYGNYYCIYEHDVNASACAVASALGSYTSHKYDINATSGNVL